MSYPLEKCNWFVFNDEPVVKSTFYAPCFSQPYVLFPGQSCDGKWHMFFHTWIGIHHFVSDSGIVWEPKKRIALRGHSPFVYFEDGYYYLLYEKHDRYIPILSDRGPGGSDDTSSRIEVKVSKDLISWSDPIILLDAKDIPYSRDNRKNARISNPQLVKTDTGYNLYFGVSCMRMPDSCHVGARYFSCAVAREIFGPYIPLEETKPISAVNPDDDRASMALGNYSILRYSGTYYALRCSFFWDSQKKKTSSAVNILSSEDGLNFKYCSDKPILVPADKGWADSYITGCNVAFNEEDKTWYCYFSACRRNKLFSRESIGLLLGTVPVKVNSEQPDHDFFLSGTSEND